MRGKALKRRHAIDFRKINYVENLKGDAGTLTPPPTLPPQPPTESWYIIVFVRIYSVCSFV